MKSATPSKQRSQRQNLLMTCRFSSYKFLFGLFCLLSIAFVAVVVFYSVYDWSHNDLKNKTNYHCFLCLPKVTKDMLFFYCWRYHRVSSRT